MKKFTAGFSLVMVLSCCFYAQAQQITLPLTQEQDGGEAGRACMYIHQGKAEYRVVKAGQACPSTLIVETSATPS